MRLQIRLLLCGMIVRFVQALNAFLKQMPLTAAVVALCASLAVIFIAAVIFCACSPVVRKASKLPFFHLVNLQTALLFALLSVNLGLESSVLPCALFWVIGYLFYGALCAFGIKKREKGGQYESAPPVQPQPLPRDFKPSLPIARTNVRLEHALNLTEKLLLRELGRSDRSELEKIKSTLQILHNKGSLSAQEGEILNESFNALLKLMAKYGE